MLPLYLHTTSPTASTADGARSIRFDRRCNMRMRTLGALEVSELGFGILSFASTYGQAPEKAESIRVIRGAHDLGVTLFDTAEVYGPWTNEALLGEALAPVRNEVVIATKFGFDVDPGTGERRGLNSQPEHIKRVTDAMLRRLGTNHIDLLYQHRVDPNVPIEDVAGAVKDLIAAARCATSIFQKRRRT